MSDRHSDIVRRVLGGLIAMVVIAAAIWMVGRGASGNGGTNVAAPPAMPAAAQDVPTAELFDQLRGAFHTPQADQSDDALAVRIPRDDVLIIVDGNEVPTAAGVEHTFYFFRCPCGTLLSHGSFLLREYEINDVMDTLRENLKFKIIGTSPFLLQEEPRMVMLRYQAEGSAEELSATLNSAFRWIGEARNQPQPMH